MKYILRNSTKLGRFLAKNQLQSNKIIKFCELMYVMGRCQKATKFDLKVNFLRLLVTKPCFVCQNISQVLIVFGMYNFGRTLASELSKQLGITVSSTFACLLSTHLETAAKQRRNYFCKVALLASFGLCNFNYGVQNRAIETYKRHLVVSQWLLA